MKQEIETLMTGQVNGANYRFLDEQSEKLATEAVEEAAHGNIANCAILTSTLIRHHLEEGHMHPAAAKRAVDTILYLEKKAQQQLAGK